MAEHRIGIEINKELAVVAFFTCAVGIGTAAGIWGLINPIIGGVIAGVVGFAITYANKGYGVIAIILSAVIFLLALFSASGGA